ncbi:fimbrial protein [Pseudomonas paraeruginosa]|uniref:fimbrial protein n=1 Tax=Pseudomonas paraeruginosa TaxID=2994495 RepID=UPI00053E9659|nr:fimbrial protein [Pseudomonas paraeruginosa]
MNTLAKLIGLSLLLLLSQKSFALACLKDNSTSTDSIALETTIAVPNVLPKGTVLWRSPNYSISMTCWQDGEYYSAEYAYFWVSPLDPGHQQLGPDLQLGVHLNGKDLLCENSSQCRFIIPEFYFQGCSNPSGCPYYGQTRTLNFNFFVAKASPPSAGKDGPLTGVSNYAAFQLDGVNQLNPNPAKNFRMYVTGLNRLRYIACSSKLSVSPKTIDFKSIQSLHAEAGKVIKDVPFQIIATKDCNSAYGLGAVLTPIGATLSGNDTTLVPNDNPSVGITLFNENRSVVPFRKEFLLVEHSTAQSVVKNFFAQLKWMTSQPTLGKFSAAAAIDIYYK